MVGKMFQSSCVFFIFDNAQSVTMSESWRQRLSRRRQEIGIAGPEYDYIQKYIEFYCDEADRQCRKIDMHKKVDQVIDSMKDEQFDRFTKGVVDTVHGRRGYDPKDGSSQVAPLNA